MAWFGSLQLAYKYAIVLGSLLFLTVTAGTIKLLLARRKLRKHVAAASHEASGAREERQELNIREMDEGDLFGIRAIQSGYFGGVSQSRPSSIAGSNSPPEPLSNALFGNSNSPKLLNASPMSSVTTLPLNARSSSPLVQNPITSDVFTQGSSLPKRKPPPIKPVLQPSNAELNGRINHDPAVNMNLHLPPSPTEPSRPPSPGSETSSISHSYASDSAKHAEKDHPPPVPPKAILSDNTRGSAVPVFTRENPTREIKSQSASIIIESSEVPMYPVARDGQRSSRIARPELPAAPPQAVRQEGFAVGGTSKSRPVSRAGGIDSVPILKPTRVISGASVWGSAIFKEIDRSLQESKSITSPWLTSTPSRRGSSHFDADSVYSNAQIAQRHASRKISVISISSQKTSKSSSSISDAPFLLAAENAKGKSNAVYRTTLASDIEQTGGSHPESRELGCESDSSPQSYSHSLLTGKRAGESGKGKMSRNLEGKIPASRQTSSPLAKPFPGT